MEKARKTGRCYLCGENGNCSPVRVVNMAGSPKVVAFKGLAEQSSPDEYTLYVCDACGARSGKSPTIHWFFAAVGLLMMIWGVINIDSPWILLLFLGYLNTMIAGVILMTKTQFDDPEGYKGRVLSQVVPVAGPVMLILNAGMINRNVRARTALEKAPAKGAGPVKTEAPAEKVSLKK